MSHAPSPIIQDILLDMQRLTPALERQRRRYNISLFFGVLVIVVMFYTFLAAVNDNPSVSNQVAIIAIAFLPCYYMYRALNRVYGKAVHKAFVDAVCKRGALTYSPLGFFEAREVERHRILPDMARSSSGEGIKGVYRDVTFTLQELSLKGKSGITFWGVVARIYINHAFEGHTVILPRTALTSAARLRFPHWYPVNPMAKKFEGQYEGLTTDTIESRAILPSSFMERLMEAGQLPRSKWMSLSFSGKEILLAYPRFRPLFVVPPLWQPVTSAEAMQRCIWEVESIFQVIDIIKMNGQIRT